ncbi:hypothetical protein HanPSC8_Chr16g0723871 [Helianthus annuus]|nr:hypothetical protein HanPSC8_Chr16g0723871 [Helianthus annuus]
MFSILLILMMFYFIGYVCVCYNIEDTNKKDGSKGKRLNLKLQDIE